MESHKGLLYPGLLKMNEGRVNKIWKLFMVFAMRGGEVLRVINVFSKMVLCKNHLESFPGCRVWALLAVQDSSIGDLVTHSLTHSLTQ